MKKMLPALFLLPVLVVAATGFAGESSVTASKKGLSQEFAEGDALVKKHCTTCHTEGRVMNALQAMNGERNEYYEKELKSIILRKIRMTNGEITRQDARKILDYLAALRLRQKPLATAPAPGSSGSTVQSGHHASVRTSARPS